MPFIFSYCTSLLALSLLLNTTFVAIQSMRGRLTASYADSFFFLFFIDFPASRLICFGSFWIVSHRIVFPHLLETLEAIFSLGCHTFSPASVAQSHRREPFIIIQVLFLTPLFPDLFHACSYRPTLFLLHQECPFFKVGHFSYCCSYVFDNFFVFFAHNFTRHLPNQSSYENFLKWGYFKHLQKEYEDRSQRKIVELEKGICRLTPLGQSFVDICIS